MNKRDLFKAAFFVASASALLKPGGQRRPEASSARVVRLPMTVVQDERYADSRSFAAAFVKAGAASFDTEQDTGWLWYSTLKSRMAREGGLLAGLTLYSDFEQLRSMGKEVRLRPLVEIRHADRGGSTLTHELHTVVPHNELVQAMTRADADWAGSLGVALAGMDAGFRCTAPTTTTVSGCRGLDRPGFLVSWLLGPA